MTEIEYKVSDLINFSSMQKPVEFQQYFNAIVTDKISVAVDTKKAEMAQTMFSSSDGENTNE